jgi:hypothetical protein
MNVRSLKLAGAAASTLLLSVIPSQAFAQTPFNVLTPASFASWRELGTSTYTFTGSMILNSIGFVTEGNSPVSLSYTIKGIRYDVTDFSVPNLSVEENGFRWLTISPESMAADDIVTVSTEFNYNGPVSYLYAGVTQDTPSTNVSYQGYNSPNWGNDATLTNSNLRVSNPSSNVAPEPGSIALLLTGGGALAGIALRRRRNAA